MRVFISHSSIAELNLHEFGAHLQAVNSNFNMSSLNFGAKYPQRSCSFSDAECALLSVVFQLRCKFSLGLVLVSRRRIRFHESLIYISELTFRAVFANFIMFPMHFCIYCFKCGPKYLPFSFQHPWNSVVAFPFQRWAPHTSFGQTCLFLNNPSILLPWLYLSKLSHYRWIWDHVSSKRHILGCFVVLESSTKCDIASKFLMFASF